MKKTDNIYLGFDIGASSVKWGYGNCKLGLQRFESLAITIKELDFLKKIFAEVLQTVNEDIGLKTISGIGIGTPGTIELSSGKIRGINPNLPFWSDISPAELIPADTKIPVFYDNDANLMCLGESTLFKDGSHVLGITVGSGIGCGYVYDNLVFHGAHGFAMELGHTIVVPAGELCNCGRKGCLEAYASVDGIKRRAHQFSHYPDAKNWDLKKLLTCAQNDSRLIRLIQEGESLLVQALVNISALLDPQYIVLGGGGMDGGLYDAERINARVQKELPLANQGKTLVSKAQAGNKAGVLGALVLAERMLR